MNISSDYMYTCIPVHVCDIYEVSIFAQNIWELQTRRKLEGKNSGPTESYPECVLLSTWSPSTVPIWQCVQYTRVQVDPNTSIWIIYMVSYPSCCYFNLFAHLKWWACRGDSQEANLSWFQYFSWMFFTVNRYCVCVCLCAWEQCEYSVLVHGVP